MVEVLEHEGAEGSEAGLAAAQVPHGGNQQVGLLLGRGQQLQQLQELLVAGHAQGEPLVQQRPAASLPLGEASIALGDRHLDQFYGLLVRSGLSSTTVLQLHRILHHALRDAMRWNLVARNVAELVTPPRRAHHNFVTFSPQQARRFLEAVKGDRLGALYILALTTGMREGELFGSDGPTSTFVAGALHLVRRLKTRSSRRQVLLAYVAVDALTRHRATQREGVASSVPPGTSRGLSSPTPRGGPCTPPTSCSGASIRCWSGPGSRASASTTCATRLSRTS
jgi:integrase